MNMLRTDCRRRSDGYIQGHLFPLYLGNNGEIFRMYLTFVLAPFWQRHLKCALLHNSVGLLWFQMPSILLTRRNTDKDCILVSLLLTDQNWRECQRIENLAIASEDLRKGLSYASKGDVKPNDSTIWKKTGDMRSRTAPTCLSSGIECKTMWRSNTLCVIFSVLHQASDASIVLQKKKKKKITSELLLSHCQHIQRRFQITFSPHLVSLNRQKK